jgi:hypothetical protein
MQFAASVASLFGLLLAIYQLWRTGRIVLASRRASARTAAQLADYAIHAQYRELLELQADLDRAIADDERDTTRVLLQHWDRRSFELLGMSEVAGVEPGDLKSSAFAAREAAVKIKSQQRSALKTVTAPASRRIDGVCGILRQSAGVQRVSGPIELQEVPPSRWADFRELYLPRRKSESGQR